MIKHQWLFLNSLDTAASVRKLVAFHVDQHNSHLPHSAFKGQTPDEMYFGTGDDIPKKLEEARLQARALRLKSNRERNCRQTAGNQVAAQTIGYHESILHFLVPPAESLFS